MKETLSTCQFMELTVNELTDLQGGGLLTNLATSASATTVGLIAFGAVGLGLSKAIVSNTLDFLI